MLVLNANKHRATKIQSLYLKTIGGSRPYKIDAGDCSAHVLWSFKKMCFPICIIISVNSYELYILFKKQLGFSSQNNREKQTRSVFLLLTTFLKIWRGIFFLFSNFPTQKYPNNSTTPSIMPSIIPSEQGNFSLERSEKSWWSSCTFRSRVVGSCWVETRDHSLTWRDVNHSLLLFWGW